MRSMRGGSAFALFLDTRIRSFARLRRVQWKSFPNPPATWIRFCEGVRPRASRPPALRARTARGRRRPAATHGDARRRTRRDEPGAGPGRERRAGGGRGERLAASRRGRARARRGRDRPGRVDSERARVAMSAAVAPRLSKADLHRVTSEEKLFHSDYNVPPGHAPGENEVRWALRGYLPPKHLRIDGYNYGIPEDSALGFPSPSIVKRESTSALMAGCFVPESGEMEHEAGVTQAHVTIGASRAGPANRTREERATARRVFFPSPLTVHGAAMVVPKKPLEPRDPDWRSSSSFRPACASRRTRLIF